MIDSGNFISSETLIICIVVNLCGNQFPQSNLFWRSKYKFISAFSDETTKSQNYFLMRNFCLLKVDDDSKYKNSKPLLLLKHIIIRKPQLLAQSKEKVSTVRGYWVKFASNKRIVAYSLLVLV